MTDEVGVRLTINGQQVFSSGAKKAEDSIKGIGSAARGANESSRSLGSGLDGLASKLNVVGTAGKFAQYYVGYQMVGGLEQAAQSAITFGVKTAGSFEQTSIALKTMLGSQDAATDFINQLSDFAQQTPFNFSGLVQTSERMMAMGFGVKDVIPDLTAIGNAASALGTGQDGIDHIVVALGQMRQSAHLNATDMMQLVNANIPAWQYLADAAHKSIAQVRKDAESGKIDPAQASDVILKGLANDPKYKGMMDAQSKTLFGMWSNMQDAVQRKARTAFAPFNEMLKQEIPGATVAASNAVDWLGNRMTAVLGGVVELMKTYKTGGIDGVLRQIGDWTGTGKTFVYLWHNIRDDSRYIGEILRNSLIPAVRDLAAGFAPEFLLALTTVHMVLSWMADHPTAGRVIFEGIALAIIGYKLYGLIMGVATAIEVLGTRLLATGAAATTFGREMAAGTGVLDAATIAGGAGAGAGAGAAAGKAAKAKKETSILGRAKRLGGTVGKVTGAGTAVYLGYEGGKALDSWMQADHPLVDKLTGSSSDADAKHQRNLYDRAHGLPDTYPGMASGGRVTTGGWSWVGERGPELLHLNAGAQVVPLNNRQRDQASGSIVFQDGAIRVSGSDVLNAQATADILVQQIKDKLARN